MSSGQHKDTRPLKPADYIRLWTYMQPDEQVFVLCWFNAFHDGVNAPDPMKALFFKAFKALLSKLGVFGQVVDTILDVWLAIQPKDVFDCEVVLKREVEVARLSAREEA